MLYGYPVAATAENWLHESLCAMLESIHNGLDLGQVLPVWPEVIPETHRDQLSTRTGLRDRLVRYKVAVTRLSAQNRRKVLTCLSQQNLIESLVSCSADCDLLNDLPKVIRKPIVDLFEFAFGLLTDLGIRDRQYHSIYLGTAYHVCPFCGCEYFDAPGAAREDLDHYLVRTLYPFAAANLRNLVPMGTKCNERYKQAQDILRDSQGLRRRSFNPYADRQLDVVLDRSIPFGGADGCTPDWQIDFMVDGPECITWDVVFRVRERFKRDVLDSSFSRWLRTFVVWFKTEIGVTDPADEQLLDAIHRYSEINRMMGLTAKEFLQAPVFTMLYKHAGEGDQRLMAFMKDLVKEAIPRT